MMLGKACNIANDVNIVDRTSEGTLKCYCDGSDLKFERKYRNAVTCQLTARLLFCSNNLPPFRDKTYGLWRRIDIIPCNAHIEPGTEIHDLHEKMIAELPGILNRVLEAGRRLVARGRFELPEASLNVIAHHRSEQNFPALWCKEHLTVASGKKQPADDIWREYDSWCNFYNITAKPWWFWDAFNNHFAAEIKDGTIKKCRVNVPRCEFFGNSSRTVLKRLRCWMNLDMKLDDSLVDLPTEEDMKAASVATAPMAPVSETTLPAQPGGVSDEQADGSIDSAYAEFDKLDAPMSVEEVDRILDELDE